MSSSSGSSLFICVTNFSVLIVFWVYLPKLCYFASVSLLWLCYVLRSAATVSVFYFRFCSLFFIFVRMCTAVESKPEESWLFEECPGIHRKAVVVRSASIKLEFKKVASKFAHTSNSFSLCVSFLFATLQDFF